MTRQLEVHITSTSKVVIDVRDDFDIDDEQQRLAALNAAAAAAGDPATIQIDRRIDAWLDEEKVL